MFRLSSIAALAVVMAVPAWGADQQDAPSALKSATKLQALQSKSSLTREAHQVVNAMTAFGLEMQNANSNAGKNITTSPFSIMSAFGLALDGAKGQTLLAISKALRLDGISTEQFNTGYAALSEGLRHISRDNTLSFGNAIFADVDFPVEEAYLANVQKSLGANAANVNYRKPEEAAHIINSYIEDKTGDMIKKMVDPSQVDGWRIALVNAGYFKGAWDFKFDVKQTYEKADFNTGRSIKQLPMMRQYDQAYLYYRGKGFQMASLAYKNAEFAMDLIVPDRAENVGNALESVQTQFTGENYRQWVANSKPTKIALGLPRFEVEYKQDLSDYFKRTMPLAFSDAADFSRLSRQPTKIDKVIHATVLKVNEEGTEGAFATVVGMSRAAGAFRPAPPQVIADRPFLLVIRHVATGTPIFVSTVWDPKPLPRPEK